MPLNKIKSWPFFFFSDKLGRYPGMCWIPLWPEQVYLWSIVIIVLNEHFLSDCMSMWPASFAILHFPIGFSTGPSEDEGSLGSSWCEIFCETTELLQLSWFIWMRTCCCTSVCVQGSWWAQESNTDTQTSSSLVCLNGQSFDSAITVGTRWSLVPSSPAILNFYNWTRERARAEKSSWWTGDPSDCEWMMHKEPIGAVQTVQGRVLP